MRRSVLPALLLLLAPLAAARAEVFYSIDINTDELVRIDSSTATVTTVGPIGHSFGGASLTLHNGTLYAITTPLCVNAFVDLVAIDPVSGAQLNSVRVKVGVTDLQASAADAVTSDGTTMYLSYRTSGACGASHVLADLSTGGAATNQTTFTNTRDMDGLAWSTSTGLIGIDGVVASPNYRTDVYAVARPSTYTLLGSHNNTGADGYAGVTFTATGELWAWAYNTHSLRRIDPANGQLLSTIAIGTTRTLRGLARAPIPPTPVESTTWSRVKGMMAE